MGDGGSSPHTRGALLSTCEDCVEHRIIPAYAGSTALPRMDHRRHVDHPRIRGEHWAWGQRTMRRAGSSPHTRGALLNSASLPGRRRIIPAYAGSTRTWRPSSRTPADHPRIRGEHRSLPFSLLFRWGSSPHTRGALAQPGFELADVGIIPAYAGSTRVGRSSLPIGRDHPRIRGEHIRPPLAERGPNGSSPHTRGAPARAVLASNRVGIIPAYAGSTEKLPYT